MPTSIILLLLILYISAATQFYILLIKLHDSKQVNSYKISVLDIYGIYYIPTRLIYI